MTTESPTPRPAARPHRAGGGTRRSPCLRPRPDRARDRRAPAGGRGGRPRSRRGPRGWSRRIRAIGTPGEDCELALVIGGDGTILRAAELTHDSSTPLLGVNLGHVGFLAEAEHEDVESTIDRGGAARATPPRTGSRSTSPRHGDQVLARTLRPQRGQRREGGPRADARGVVEIDGRPLSRWGCDGVVCATPTGSTAYNFSAGGPVVWPEVEALLMVPISAHALFARPMVVAPTRCSRSRCWPAPRAGRVVVRRPSHRRPAAGRPDRGAPRRPPGASGAPARGAVHRPAGREVRPAGRGLARHRRGSRQRRQGHDA